MELLFTLNQQLKCMHIDYALCGGTAIDMFIGRKTRPHKDLDVSAYWEDRDFIVQYMLDREWIIYEPVGTQYLHKVSSVSSQKRVKSNIWCVRPDNSHYIFTEQGKDMYEVLFDNSEQSEVDFVEFLFNKKDGNYFY